MFQGSITICSVWRVTLYRGHSHIILFKHFTYWEYSSYLFLFRCSNCSIKSSELTLQLTSKKISALLEVRLWAHHARPQQVRIFLKYGTLAWISFTLNDFGTGKATLTMNDVTAQPRITIQSIDTMTQAYSVFFVPKCVFPEPKPRKFHLCVCLCVCYNSLVSLHNEYCWKWVDSD